MKNIKITFLLIGLVFTGQLVKSQSFTEEIQAIADIIVDINGSGNYTSVSAAIAAIPNYSTDTTIVFVKKGVYDEKVILGHMKHNVVFVGEDVDSTIITGDDYGDQMLVGGDPAVGGHTFSTYTFRADPSDFQAYNITFENTTKAGQGVAYHANGDRQILYHCHLSGHQDTYFDNFRSRRYFKDCLISGNTDYIFGFGVALFDSCEILGEGGGWYTASATPQYYKFGHVFKNCRVVTRGSGVMSLGRPWFSYANTMFFECYMDGVSGRGWDTWSGRENTCLYYEYKNYGPDADTTERVSFGHQLDPALAGEYTIENIFAASTFPSDMGPKQDSIEFFSMRNRFTESGYTARADTILYAGLDTFPEYPKDDWVPVFHREIKAIVDKYYVPFNDSVNFGAEIISLEYDGNTIDYNPDESVYSIELDPSTTVAPKIKVNTNSKAITEITYPESIPGFTKIKVVSYDRSTITINLSVYNSINNAFANANADSIVILGEAIPNFESDKYEYDVVLPEGTKRLYKSKVKVYPTAFGAEDDIEVPGDLPGDLIIDVTAPNKTATSQYIIHLTVASDIEQATWGNFNIYAKQNQVVMNVNAKRAQTVSLTLYSVDGKEAFSNTLSITSGHNIMTIPTGLQPGVYLYQVDNGSEKVNGKISIN